jgi:tetratricopeptide (TPR) repeat protein
VRALIEADHPAFYGNKAEEDVSRNESERQTIHYGAAWKLVHFFLHGPDARYRDRFLELLRRVQAGSPPRDAFYEVFERDLPQIEREFRGYLAQARLSRLAVDIPSSPAGPPPEERTLRDAEVHLLWARLLPRSERKEELLEQAWHHLEEALSHDPKSPEVRFRRGIFLLRQHKLDAAAGELDRALAVHPDEPRYLFARLAWYHEAQARHGSTPERDPDVPQYLVDRLARVARSAAQLNAAGAYTVTRGRTDDGLRLIDRAIAADPLCWRCPLTRAGVLAKLEHRSR